MGYYFPKIGCLGKPVSRVDKNIAFNWGGGSPMQEIPGDNCYMWWDTAFELLHDLKTPLTSILGYVELLKSVERTPETQEEFLGIIEFEAEKLFPRGLLHFRDLRRVLRIQRRAVTLHGSPDVF